MDKQGLFYRLTDKDVDLLEAPIKDLAEEDLDRIMELKIDSARLDGYLRGRADSDRPKRGKGSNKDLTG